MMTAFIWYNKYRVFKEEEIQTALTEEEYELFQKLGSKILANRNPKKEYIVISNKDTEVYKIAKQLVEQFSIGK